MKKETTQPPQGKSAIDDHATALVAIVQLTAQRDELLKACQGLEQGAINVIASTVANGQRYSLYPSCLALATLETASKAARAAIANATEGGTNEQA